MKKLLAVLLLLACCRAGRAQELKRYHLALTATNPLSATFKYGGGLEYRMRNFAYVISYNKYKGGAYPGTEADMDLRLYLRRRKVYEAHKWPHQSFVYVRGIFGDAAFVGKNLTVLGYSNKAERASNAYLGGSAGYGRRYSHGHLFFTGRVGLRACVLPDISADDKDEYRIFYVTGPGSILELNFQVGVQI